ncbi:IS701 family transposase [Marinitenerispora sediminis]|uniref:IS701 family transposase n=1 Tax=Marinitenerispora sediminis TaxID=1931232 RepID=A0A368T0H8_9ACTN|nr:IS701 family transposase [Marinitenerispora sediminis]RCV52511.1 IS701 family transposase [Marinitenerispora sediminis]RCV53809.1 IS701 family transposase [Marinitenerispora sediminis]RCV58209.1 IS701 family transposase [Marinitenerispora sediminis]
MVDELTELCQDLLSSLPRRDQRRWGLAYIHGLVSCRGRKSIQNMAALVEERGADQSLQQFVNQSPWDWRPVRGRLAERAVAALRPRAWVVNEVVFPKTGRHSVGVEYQFAGSLGRAVNCQLGLALSAAGAGGGALPLNWRLQLPRAWDGDADRRRRTYLPDEERHRPLWALVLELVDEAVREWRLPAAPVVADLRHCGDAERLAAALHERGVGYLLRVNSAFTARFGHGSSPARRSVPVPAALRAAHRLPEAQRVSALADALATRSRGPVAGLEGRAAGGRSSHLLTVPISPQTARGPLPRRPAPPRSVPARLLLRWPAGQPQPESFWVTNLHRRLPQELVELWLTHAVADRQLGRMRERFGLTDFEGRSYRGWHHHVTLASVAAASRVLGRPGVGELVRERVLAD